jgi:iron complex transport system ATP-binding protein
VSLLVFEDISFDYEGPVILDGINLRVTPGSLCAVLGPNGCGKTTLIKTGLGILKPRRGKVLLEGIDLSRIPARQRGRSLSYMGQNTSVWMPYTVKEIILMGAYPKLGMSEHAGTRYESLIEELLHTAGLPGISNRSYASLSGGQQQLVQLCRVLLQDTPMIMLDEPVANLDLQYQRRVLEILRKKTGEGQSALMSLHSLQLASEFCDRVFILHRGRIEAQGRPGEILTPDLISQVYDVDMPIAEKIYSKLS